MNRARARAIPRWLVRLAALVCVLSVVTALFAQGHRYFVCAMDGGMHFDRCCAEEVRGEAPEASDVPCCAAHELRVLPAASPAAFAASFDPSLVPASTELAPVAATPFVAVSCDLAVTTWSRAGPAPPPTLARRLARLSVLHS